MEKNKSNVLHLPYPAGGLALTEYIIFKQANHDLCWQNWTAKQIFVIGILTIHSTTNIDLINTRQLSCVCMQNRQELKSQEDNLHFASPKVLFKKIS